MNDLLSKLNTLARARLNDALPSLPNLPRFERAPDLQRQVTDLRQRINAALDHEDTLQAQVNELRDEVARLDADADTALAEGQDGEARRILEQLKRTEQRLSFAESDLKMHQRDAAELILKVNQLEAAVADHQAAVAGMGDHSTEPSDSSSAYTPSITSSANTSSTSAPPTSRLESPPKPVTPAASTSAPSTTPMSTPSEPSETLEQPAQPEQPIPPARTQIPVESSPTMENTVPITSTLDTSIAANADDLPEEVYTELLPAEGGEPTVVGAAPTAAPITNPAETVVEDEDQPETAKSYAKRAREAAHQQADKTTSAVDQISGMIADAQQRTRARIQSLTDILEAKDREQAASPLYNREQQDAPGASPTTSPVPETRPSAPSDGTGSPDETPPKSEDTLSERLKRLSKPE